VKPRALILHATGTNRDNDAALAFDVAGALPEIVHINQLRQRTRLWSDYQILVVPGGFSYADALGAGRLLALDLLHYFSDEVNTFVEQGKPVIGICNGFQALVKSGILPGSGKQPGGFGTQSTLTFNASGHFECRWVNLQPVSQKCIWTAGLDDLITCPVAHGEGNFRLADGKMGSHLAKQDQIALFYTRPDGSPAHGEYPDNPNGSTLDIAGISNVRGNVLGLMPHPENHLFITQHPQRLARRSGLPLFVNGVRSASA
jgi:phosphoribosylformylglycinamidine synthase subunit PurQ / glutaminase